MKEPHTCTEMPLECAQVWGERWRAAVGPILARGYFYPMPVGQIREVMELRRDSMYTCDSCFAKFSDACVQSFRDDAAYAQSVINGTVNHCRELVERRRISQLTYCTVLT